MMNNWKDFPRKKDKLAIVGFAETSRHLAPFGNPEYEIWGMNEACNFDWMERCDRLFQIHPIWDVVKTVNPNDYNHYDWLKGVEASCNQCKGSGKLGKDGEVECPGCKGTGIYKPKKREGVIVYMGKYNPEVPNCIQYPLHELSAQYFSREPFSGKGYFRSTMAYALILAYAMGFKRIEMYGFEMAMESEYHYQRSNFEYIIGLGHGLGIELYLPPNRLTLLKGELYAYESMKMGYRQQLDMRAQSLNNQLEKYREEVLKRQGKVEILTELVKDNPNLQPILEKAQRKLHRGADHMQFLSGAGTETNNLMSMFDSYFAGMDETANSGNNNDERINAETSMRVGLVYQPEEEHAEEEKGPE